MILIVTHSRDVGADYVIRHLYRADAKYVRLNTDQLGRPGCFIGARAIPELHFDGKVISNRDLTAIWARRFAMPEVLKEAKDEHVEFIKRELTVMLDAFLEGTPRAFEINSSAADRLAGNRIIQAGRANSVGFAVPDALVTQDIVAARDFIASHDGVICKALSFGQVSSSPGAERVAYASLIAMDTDLSGLALCPLLLQERIPKRYDWRITTVGNRAFCARAAADEESDVLDWRTAKDHLTKFERAEPPTDVLEKLSALNRGSNLVYGAHDLIETASGEFVFLETNPAGQFGWLELSLGLPIGLALAEELMAAGR